MNGYIFILSKYNVYNCQNCDIPNFHQVSTALRSSIVISLLFDQNFVKEINLLEPLLAVIFSIWWKKCQFIWMWHLVCKVKKFKRRDKVVPCVYLPCFLIWPPSKHLLVLKTSWRHVLKTSWRRVRGKQNVYWEYLYLTNLNLDLINLHLTYLYLTNQGESKMH